MSKLTKEQEIIEGLKQVCICKGIKKREILARIRAGASTVEEVRKATGAGSGSCKGERCTPRIIGCLKKQGCLPDKQ